MINQINYYKEHSYMTDIKEHQDFIGKLPKDVFELSKLIQNALLHNHVQHLYKVTSNETLTKEELPLRSMNEMIQGFKHRGMLNLHDQRVPDERLLGICRDYSVMLTSLLREIGVAARARCGFASYLEQGKYVDHWVCEYFDESQSKWIKFDAQIDDLQKTMFESAIGKSIDFTHVNDEEFIIAAKAWQMARNNEVDAELFGILDWWGYDYLICNLILDINSLLKVPLEPWDMWEGYKSMPYNQLTKEDKLVLDEVAKIVIENDIDRLVSFVNNHPKLSAPSDLSQVTCLL